MFLIFSQRIRTNISLPFRGSRTAILDNRAYSFNSRVLRGLFLAMILPFSFPCTSKYNTLCCILYSSYNHLHTYERASARSITTHTPQSWHKLLRFCKVVTSNTIPNIRFLFFYTHHIIREILFTTILATPFLILPFWFKFSIRPKFWHQCVCSHAASFLFFASCFTKYVICIPADRSSAAAIFFNNL